MHEDWQLFSIRKQDIVKKKKKEDDFVTYNTLSNYAKRRQHRPEIGGKYTHQNHQSDQQMFQNVL